MIERLNDFRALFMHSLTTIFTPSRQPETVAHALRTDVPVSQWTLRNIEDTKLAICENFKNFNSPELKISHAKDPTPRNDNDDVGKFKKELRDELTAICKLLNDANAGNAIRQKAFRVLQRIFHPKALEDTKHSLFKCKPDPKILTGDLVRRVHNQLCRHECFYRFDEDTRKACLRSHAKIS